MRARRRSATRGPGRGAWVKFKINIQSPKPTYSSDSPDDAAEPVECAPVPEDADDTALLADDAADEAAPTNPT